MDKTADDFFFEEFRARIERRSKAPGQLDLRGIEGTCRWVSTSGVFGSGQYCFGAKKQEDTKELLSFFAKNDHVLDLRDFPERLCDVAFCELHSAAAKPLCKDARFFDSRADAIVTTQAGDDEKQLVLWEPVQWLRFGDDGDDGAMHVAMGDGQEGDSGLRVDFNHEERVVDLIRKDTHGNGELENKNRLGNTEDKQAAINVNNVKDKQKVEAKYSSPRDKMFRSSRSQDYLHQSDVAKAEKELISLMQKEIKVQHGTRGYVYAFRDPELKLIKFGSTGQFITTRLGHIQSVCKPGKPLEIVAGLELESFLAYEVLEKLIHKYLQPHRWYFNCIHGKENPTGTRHREYFDISEEAARDVFRVWRNFMSLHPFDRPISYTRWSLNPKWAVRIKNIRSPLKHETHKDHSLKLERWEEVLSHPGKDLTDLEKASNAPDRDTDIKIPAGKLPSRAAAFVKSERSQSAGGELLCFSSQVKSEQIADLTPTRFSLGIPDTLLIGSRSAPSTPMLCGIDSKTNDLGGSASETKNTLLVDTLSMQNADNSKSFGKRPARSAASIQKETSGRLFGPPPTNRTPQSVPTRTFTFETPTPGQRQSPKSRDASVPQIKLESESRSSKDEQSVPDDDHETITNESHVDASFDLDWNAKYRELEKVLLREREGLPSRTIWQDLVQFRWPLSFAIFLAAYSSYAPSLLNTITWILFLPCLVAELRSWFPELVRHQ